MNLDIWNYFLLTVLIISSAFRPSSADTHIDHKEENLVTNIKSTNQIVFTSIAKNVDTDITKYENESGVQIYLQKPAKEIKDDKIVYNITATKNDGSANWFTNATSKGSTREETVQLVKEPNEQKETHIDHKEENLVTNIRSTNQIVFTSIAENVDAEIAKYENEAGVQIYLQKPAKGTKDDKIVYSITKTKTDGTANWFTYATSKGSTREETVQLVKDPNEQKETLDVKGTYSYVGNDGVRYIVGYSAGKNGYRPKVLFGTKVNIEEIPVIDFSDRTLKTDKGSSSLGGTDLMCSLIGSGCL